jgi:hypothetical protein
MEMHEQMASGKEGNAWFVISIRETPFARSGRPAFNFFRTNIDRHEAAAQKE